MSTIADIKAKLKGYKNKDKTAEQMFEVISNFPHLRISKPTSATCAEEAMLNDKCLALCGTIPVHISGNRYFIPLSLIVTTDHPRSAPHVYLKPTNEMELVLSSMVNQFGRVSISFLKHWNRESSLIDLVNVMAIEFADQCPVQAKTTRVQAAPIYHQQPSNPPTPSYISGSGSDNLQRSLGMFRQNQHPNQPNYPPNAGNYQSNPGNYQRQTSLPQDTMFYQRQLETERAHHQQILRDEQARAERNLYDKEQLLNQTQQAMFREQQRAESLNQRVTELERELSSLRSQFETAENGKRMAEDRARALERGVADKQERQYWMVGKDEIQLEQKELGTGGWGTVKVAKFRHMEVAAKFLHQMIISDYNRDLFVREMNMAARMRHPNIVQFIGASMEGKAVILTELMPTNLRAQYSKQMFTYRQIILISGDIAKGLNYLHLMNPDPIIHRDISSANVLLEPLRDNKWRAKICDCGSANFAQLTNTVAPGNPTYAAPEAENPRAHTPKMDVFSYGVVLLETNTQRFPDPQTRELLFDMLGHRQEMIGLIRWCTKHTAADRPSMEEVLVTLEEIDTKSKSR